MRILPFRCIHIIIYVRLPSFPVSCCQCRCPRKNLFQLLRGIVWRFQKKAIPLHRIWRNAIFNLLRKAKRGMLVQTYWRLRCDAVLFQSTLTDLFFFEHAEIAQLVEHNLAKVGVAGPSPVFRSNVLQVGNVVSISPGGGIGRRARFRCVCREACRFESCSGHGGTFQCWRGGGIGRRATLRG